MGKNREFREQQFTRKDGNLQLKIAKKIKTKQQTLRIKKATRKHENSLKAEP